MADVFTNLDMIKLLENKTILFIGDHNIRNVYKDLICLYQTNEHMELDHISRNLEESYFGDTMIYRQNMYKERNYGELRMFQTKELTLEFLFVTQCLSPTLVQHLYDIRSGLVKAPDVIYMNSFLWDFTRWGPKTEANYTSNIHQLINLLENNLPEMTLFIWATTSPVSIRPNGIPFVPQIPQVNLTMYSNILEGNFFATSLFRFHGFDVIDNYYHLFRHAHRRAPDGIRYLPSAYRYVSYLLLTHLALSWDKTLPGRIDNAALHLEISRSKEKYTVEKLPHFWLDTNQKAIEQNKQTTNKQEFENNNNLVNNLQILNTNTARLSPEKTPIIRVKSTWEVLKEFSENDGVFDDCSNINNGNENKSTVSLDEIKPSINNIETMVSDVCEESSDAGTILNFKDDMLVKEEQNKVEKKRKEDLEEGEITEDEDECEEKEDQRKLYSRVVNEKQNVFREVKEKNVYIQKNNYRNGNSYALNDWQRWKYRQFVKHSNTDLITLEIPKYIHKGPLKLKAANKNTRLTAESMFRIKGFIKQMKCNWIKPPWKHNKSIKKGSLLFGYDKNERCELFRPKITKTYANVNDNVPNSSETLTSLSQSSNINWVADQWRKILLSEKKESVEVLSIWQRSFTNEKEELEAKSVEFENFNKMKNIEKNNCTISFL